MARTTKNRYLLLEDIRSAKNPAALLRLFSLLGYQVESTVVALAKEEIGFAPGDAAATKNLYLLADQGGNLQIILFELEDVAMARLRSLAANFLARGGHYLLVATSNYRRLVFVSPRREGGKVKIRKLVVDTIHPTRHDLDVLEGLAVDGRHPDALYQAQCQAFDVERVTNRFYQEYAALFGRVEAALKEHNKGVAAFYEPRELHAFSQRFLGRLMFLYFIQKKGWLAGDPRFLTNQFHQAGRQESNYYLTVLEPLFFDTLNRRRDNDSSRWGPIPYLNGGLFEPDRDRHGRDIANLYLPNELFDPDSGEGILAFFNNYNFTIAEDTPSEQEVAVDPEMLGKVFENMMEEAERGKSGTFYTPRPIVHYMCREALLGYLQDQTGLGRDLLQSQFEAADEDVDRNQVFGKNLVSRLTVEQSRRLEAALTQVRVLDPAVGTGAFLVGMLQELVNLRRACHLARGVTVARSTAEVAEWKRQFIANCLYGVDIKRRAIEIARLRLWLSLVVDLERDQVEPLPNLDYKLMVGNSLIETIDGRPVLTLEPKPNTQMGLGLSPTEQAISRLVRLKDVFFDAGPEARRELRAQIQEQEKTILLSNLQERLEALGQKRDAIGRKGALVNWKGMAKEQKELERLAAEMARLSDLAAQVRRGEPLPFFLYRLHFFEVFRDKGGFDVVIANPPYVNTKDTSSLDYLDTLRIEYGWSDDLYAHFIFRGFGLVRPNGYVAYITSDTFFTISTKQRVRELLHSKALTKLIQCDPFSATVDAAVFIAANHPPDRTQTVEFVQARRASHDEFDFLAQDAAWLKSTPAQMDGKILPVYAAFQGNMRRYIVPLAVYESSLNQVFFEPSEANVVLYNRYMPHLKTLVGQWWDKIKDSRRFAQYLREIEAYCARLKPGEVAIIGLVAEGGVGLQTGDNGRFLGYLKGSPQAEAILARRQELVEKWRAKPLVARRFAELSEERGDFAGVVDALKLEFDWTRDLELQRGEIYRIVEPEHVFEVAYLTEGQRQQIIEQGLESPRCWLPYRKGDREGNKWVSLDELYICWSIENAKHIQTSSKARWQGYDFFLTEGITWSDTANHAPLKARINPLCFFDVSGMRLTPLWTVSANYFLGLLNADLMGYISKKFLNNTQKYQIGNLRLLPLVVPTPHQHSALVSLTEQAIEVQTALLQGQQQGQVDSGGSRALELQLEAIQSGVNVLVEEIYGVSGMGPFDDF